jgi:hypothetical protein
MFQARIVVNIRGGWLPLCLLLATIDAIGIAITIF